MTEKQFKEISPAESYSEVKGTLWHNYMRSITPLLKDYQEIVRGVCDDMMNNPKKSRSAMYKIISKSGWAYIDAAQTAFQDYIQQLTWAYANDQIKKHVEDTKYWLTYNKRYAAQELKRKLVAAKKLYCKETKGKKTKPKPTKKTLKKSRKTKSTKGTKKVVKKRKNNVRRKQQR